MIPTAVDKAVLLMESVSVDSQPCQVCRGGWFYDEGNECFGSVHAPDCPHAEDEPPEHNTGQSQEREQG